MPPYIVVPAVGLILVDEVKVPGVSWAGIFGDVGRGVANVVPVNVGKKRMLIEVRNTIMPQSLLWITNKPNKNNNKNNNTYVHTYQHAPQNHTFQGMLLKINCVPLCDF